MNWLDWVLLASVSLSSGIALWRGVIREAVGLLIWAVSFLLVSRVGRWWGGTLLRWSSGNREMASFPWDDTGGVLGRLGLFLVVLAFCAVAIRLLAMPFAERLQWLVSRSGLGWADRMAGCAFGLARGVCVILLAFLLLQRLSIPEPSWVSRSHLAPLMHRGAVHLAQRLPEDVLMPFQVWAITPEYSDVSTPWTPRGDAR